MDVQLYYEKILIPTLDLLVDYCKNGNITKEQATKLGNKITKMKLCSLEWSKNICEVMEQDALAHFKNELSKI